jgi:hypothetical protein
MPFLVATNYLYLSVCSPISCNDVKQLKWVKMCEQPMNEEMKYSKERSGNTGHVIPHFDGSVPSPDSLSPQLLTQTARYTQSVANLARGTVRTDSGRADLRQRPHYCSLRYGTQTSITCQYTGCQYCLPT